MDNSKVTYNDIVIYMDKINDNSETWIRIIDLKESYKNSYLKNQTSYERYKELSFEVYQHQNLEKKRYYF